MLKGNIIANSLTREKLEKFLDEKYPGQFDCSKVPEHFYSNDLITLICKKDGHGEFQITYTKIIKNKSNPCWRCRAYTREDLLLVRTKNGMSNNFTLEDVPDFVFQKDEIVVNCKKHGKFKTTVYNFLILVEPCPTCRKVKHPELTKDYLIEYVDNKFPGQFSFDKVPETFKCRDYIILTCKKHGDFKTTFFDIKRNKKLCKECRKEIKHHVTKFSPTRKLVEDLCHTYFNDMYDCSLVPEIFHYRNKFHLIEKETNKIISIYLSTLKSKCERIKNGTANQLRKNKLTKDMLMSFSSEKYGPDAFDFSNVPDTFKEHDKFEIICNKDGHHFMTSWLNFKKVKIACPECRKNVDFFKLTKNDLMKLVDAKFKKFNYDYSKVPERFGFQDLLTIICPMHGEFQITYQILRNAKIPCDKCCMLQKDDIIKYIQNTFIDTDYDFSLVPDYFRSTTKFTIICPKHGEFETSYIQITHNFNKNRLCVCNECNKERVNEKFLNEFKKKASEVHYGFYDYSKSEYNGSLNLITIICPIHGEFQQQVNSHLHGNGCPACGELFNKTKNIIIRVLDENNIKYTLEQKFKWLKYVGSLRLDIYIKKYKIAIEVQGQQHFDNNPYFDRNGETYEIRHKRDTIKKRLCEEHGIDLFYFSDKQYAEEYDLGKVYTDPYELFEEISKLISVK